MKALTRIIIASCLSVAALGSTASAQGTPTITYLLRPIFTGGTPTSITTLENPLAYYVQVDSLEPNTSYDQVHTGFLTFSTTSTRGSKWTGSAWVSPSTAVLNWITTDANGSFKGWAFVRSPSSYIVGVDTAQFRFRVRKNGTTTNITFDSPPFTSLLWDSSAADSIAGAVVYGYTDTVSTNYTGKFVSVYQNAADENPLSTWLVFKSPESQVESDLFTTRTDTTLRRAGYFQLVVPANTPIAKVEIRDSSNTVLKTWLKSWTSGVAGSLTQLDLSGATSVEPVGVRIPGQFALDQNFPNPFNPETRIAFNVPRESHVTLRVYNVLGQKIATLIDEQVSAGAKAVRWSGRDDAGRAMPTGIYIYRIDAPGFSQARRMVLMK